MTLLFNWLMVSIVLAVNLTVFHLCSKKKHPLSLTVWALAGFTLVYAAMLMSLRLTPPDGVAYNGVYFLFGMPYVLVLWKLYDQPFRVTATIMGTLGTYTLFLFAIAARVGKALPLEPASLSVFLLFCILLTFTLPFALTNLRGKYTLLIGRMEQARQRDLLGISMLHFWLLWLMNFQFARGGDRFLPMQLTVFSIAGLGAMLSYRLLYTLTNSQNAALRLREEARRDPLTGLKNRLELMRDTRRAMRSGMGFDLIFLDLDRFKEVNDQHGHAAGDRYIVAFADAVRALLDDKDAFYRLSGDEFVALHTSEGGDAICANINGMTALPLPEGIAFLGTSAGLASYPKDGDTLNDLLCVADARMYREKNSKRHPGPIPTS